MQSSQLIFTMLNGWIGRTEPVAISASTPREAPGQHSPITQPAAPWLPVPRIRTGRGLEVVARSHIFDTTMPGRR